MRKLFLLPVRGGSKGLPRKNILPLAGRPMIYYTLDAAIGAIEEGDEICVSSDDDEIIQAVEDYGVKVPFVRPSELAADDSTSEDVLSHAMEWYQSRGKYFDVVVLLQATSPLRKTEHIVEAMSLWRDDIDMVVSVKQTESNPYFNLFEEDEEGFLKISKRGNFTRRQECPKVFEYNGAIYIYNSTSLRKGSISNFTKIRKYLMDAESSIDIDTRRDLILANIVLDGSLY